MANLQSLVDEKVRLRTTRLTRGLPAAITSHWRVVVLSVIAAVAIYGVVVGLLLPPFARKTIAENLGDRWGRGVVIDDLTINSYTLGVTVKGFRILESDC